MYKIRTTHQFEKDVLHCKKRGLNLGILREVMELLEQEGKLPAKYKSHVLSGKFNNCWECHIKSDWLLLWEQNDTNLTLLFLNTGTHSDLF
jgi:mRNA interferase YafQ